MIVENIRISNIHAILWGEKSNKIIIAVHGNMSSKSDVSIDYYQYVKNNPIRTWNVPTAILYGRKDELCEYKFVYSFSKKFHCKIDMSDSSGHYFHTESDMEIYRNWIRASIVK